MEIPTITKNLQVLVDELCVLRGVEKPHEAATAEPLDAETETAADESEEAAFAPSASLQTVASFGHSLSLQTVAHSLSLPQEVSDAKVLTGKNLDGNRNTVVIDAPQWNSKDGEDGDDDASSVSESSESSEHGSHLSALSEVDPEDWDTDKWYRGLCDMFDKLKIREGWECMFALRKLTEAKTAEREQIMEKICEADGERQRETEKYSKALTLFDKEIEESQVNAFSALSTFNTRLHEAVTDINHMKTRRRKRRTETSFSFSDMKTPTRARRIWEEEDQGDAQDEDISGGKSEGGAGELLRVISGQQNQIAALKTNAVLAGKRLAAHHAALDHVKNLQNAEGAATELPEDVQNVLTEVISKKDTQGPAAPKEFGRARSETTVESAVKRDSTQSSISEQQSSTPDPHPEAAGNESAKQTRMEDKMLMKEIVNMKKMIKEVKEAMQSVHGKQGQLSRQITERRGARTSTHLRPASSQLVQNSEATSDEPARRSSASGRLSRPKASISRDPADIAEYFTKVQGKIHQATAHLKKAEEEKRLLYQSIEMAENFTRERQQSHPEPETQNQPNDESAVGNGEQKLAGEISAPEGRRASGNEVTKHRESLQQAAEEKHQVQKAVDNMKAEWKTLAVALQAAVGEPPPNSIEDGAKILEKKDTEIAKLRSEVKVLMQADARGQSGDGEGAASPVERDSSAKAARTSQVRDSSAEADDKGNHDVESRRSRRSHRHRDRGGGDAVIPEDELASQRHREHGDRSGRRRRGSTDVDDATSRESVSRSDRRHSDYTSTTNELPPRDETRSSRRNSANNRAEGERKVSMLLSHDRAEDVTVSMSHSHDRGRKVSMSLSHHQVKRHGNGPDLLISNSNQKEELQSEDIEDENAQDQIDRSKKRRYTTRNTEAGRLIRNEESSAHLHRLLQVQNENLQIGEQIRFYAEMLAEVQTTGQLGQDTIARLQKLRDDLDAEAAQDGAEIELSEMKLKVKGLQRQLKKKRIAWKVVNDSIAIFAKILQTTSDPQSASDMITHTHAKLVIDIMTRHTDRVAAKQAETARASEVSINSGEPKREKVDSEKQTSMQENFGDRRPSKDSEAFSDVSQPNITSETNGASGRSDGRHRTEKSRGSFSNVLLIKGSHVEHGEQGKRASMAIGVGDSRRGPGESSETLQNMLQKQDAAPQGGMSVDGSIARKRFTAVNSMINGVRRLSARKGTIADLSVQGDSPQGHGSEILSGVSSDRRKTAPGDALVLKGHHCQTNGEDAGGAFSHAMTSSDRRSSQGKARKMTQRLRILETFMHSAGGAEISTTAYTSEDKQKGRYGSEGRWTSEDDLGMRRSSSKDRHLVDLHHHPDVALSLDPQDLLKTSKLTIEASSRRGSSLAGNNPAKLEGRSVAETSGNHPAKPEDRSAEGGQPQVMKSKSEKVLSRLSSDGTSGTQSWPLSSSRSVGARRRVSLMDAISTRIPRINTEMFLDLNSHRGITESHSSQSPKDSKGGNFLSPKGSKKMTLTSLLKETDNSPTTIIPLRRGSKRPTVAYSSSETAPQLEVGGVHMQVDSSPLTRASSKKSPEFSMGHRSDSKSSVDSLHRGKSKADTSAMSDAHTLDPNLTPDHTSEPTVSLAESAPKVSISEATRGSSEKARILLQQEQ